MSKATIGGVIGAVIGFYVGGPTGAQVGFMIGSGIGASFDTIQGRKVGEMSSPRAQEGEPIPLVFGTARVTGRLMSCGEPSIVEEGGKGGPQVVNETAYLDYSILVCESSELRNSLVGGIIMVIQNNKIVYDVTPESEVLAADNAKWLENKRFYYGEESQGTDPTEEMIHGAGNVPAYRGLCRMVVTHEDVTQHGGGVPTYEFVVSRCAVEPPNHLLVTGSDINPGDPLLAGARAESPLSFVGIPQSSGGTITGGVPAYYGGKWVVHSQSGNVGQFSTDNRQTWTPFTTDRACNGFIAAGPGGMLVNGQGSASAWDTLGLAPTIGDPVSTLEFATEHPPGTPLRLFGKGNEANGVFFDGVYYWIDTGARGELVRTTDLSLATQQVVYKRPGAEHLFLAFARRDGVVYAATIAGKIISSADLGVTWTVELDTAPFGAHSPVYLKSGNSIVLALSQDSSKVWTSADGFAAPHDTGIAGDTTGNPPLYCRNGRGEMMAYTGGNFYIIASSNSITPALGDMGVMTADGINFEEPAPLPVRGATGITSGADRSVAGGGMVIPDAPDYAIDPVTGEVTGPENDVANACGMTLQEIFDHLDNLAGIPSGNRDSDAVADIIVPGYAIDQFMTVAEAKEPLRQIYRVACPEYDDKIRYRPYGLATDFTIDPDDLILTEESTEKGVRGQTVEFPKRLHVQYVDPQPGYKPMKQTAERISPDIRVKGELVSGANITLEADTAKQAADIGLKVAWTEREDSREFALPIDYFAETIPAHTFMLDGRRYRITEMRLDAGAIYISSVYDRISAYQSNAVGTVGPRPTPPPSQVRGPTISMVMNAPVLRDADDKAGIYWAGCGPMEGWQGARLQVSRDSGATWENGPIITAPAVMGELTATLPAASRYAQDNTNTLAVTLYREETLDSTDFEGLIEERNVFAIQYPDGTVEVCQFETATEIADRQWELTGLMRGRQDTVAGEHLAGAKFVLLEDAVRFVAIRPDDVGKTLKFRAVSLGTDPDAAEVQDVTFTTIESLREWQPYNVAVTEGEDGGYCVEWIGRARLGSSRTPVHSQWFDGYRVTFTLGTQTYNVDTTAQAICVDAATLSAEFGTSQERPVITVRTRSSVATNDDDFDSPPATDDPYPTPPYIVGDLIDGFVGVDYTFLHTDGLFSLDGNRLGGLTIDGAMPPGVTFRGSEPVGIPLTAGTYNLVLDFIAATGSVNYTKTVTIAAKPTYTMLDWSPRAIGRSQIRMIDMHTAATKATMVGMAGVSSGTYRAEFTVLATADYVKIGVCANSSTQPNLFANGAAGYIATAPGLYAVELNAGTGAWTVDDAAGVSLASGTLALTDSDDGKYRLGFAVGTGLESTVTANFGNSAWGGTPTGGYVGIPFGSRVVPVMWDSTSSGALVLTSDGTYNGYPISAEVGYGAYAMDGDGIGLGTFGKSSGQWRFQIGARLFMADQSFGLAKATTPVGKLGGAVATDSIGVQLLSGSNPDTVIIRYNFGGVASTLTVSRNPGIFADSIIVFAVDFTANTVGIYSDQNGTLVSLATLTGLPAGTWFPAVHAIPGIFCRLTHDPIGPSGYNDWTETL